MSSRSVGEGRGRGADGVADGAVVVTGTPRCGPRTGPDPPTVARRPDRRTTGWTLHRRSQGKPWTRGPLLVPGWRGAHAAAGRVGPRRAAPCPRPPWPSSSSWSPSGWPGGCGWTTCTTRSSPWPATAVGRLRAAPAARAPRGPAVPGHRGRRGGALPRPAGGHAPGGPGSAWWGWLGVWPVAVVLALTTLSVLCFPDGRLPSRRWRPVAGLVVGPSPRSAPCCPRCGRWSTPRSTSRRRTPSPVRRRRWCRPSGRPWRTRATSSPRCCGWWRSPPAGARRPRAPAASSAGCCSRCCRPASRSSWGWPAGAHRGPVCSPPPWCRSPPGWPSCTASTPGPAPR